ncbi:precorrin-2 C(20)-methyltransferase [Proteiniphilum acetatigenes]|uniref:precorrin-2 C(20)-methyltransferase n=1 Tax=Proteiniphilum acetatigenes TaxID=294710 RepID=UPI000380B6D0|nr:precorrin-2 C(20)-methyltransferase [Proteiniphilum acetatigenes]
MEIKKQLPVCVSLGPGDAGLVTLKALKTLQEVSIIYCPATQSDGKPLSRAKDILDEISIDTQKIRIFLVPMSKDRTLAEKVYSDIAIEIAGCYQTGRSVAFVAEGDSGFYSSVHYISDKLEEMDIDVQHIAGVPAFIACGALAGIHVVKQDERLSVFPSGTSTEEIVMEVEAGKSVVLMKLSQQKDTIKKTVEALSEAQFHYFENVGIAQKEFYTNDRNEITQRLFPYFSLLIIKKIEREIERD